MYHVDEQYLIRKNEDGEDVIHPVDYANTGITLKNTIWQYGLHQFLQLKHNLRLTSESMTSCFVSNLGYINKYGSKIYGCTGTLGSEAEKELLSSLYNVSFVNIPTLKEKQFIELDGVIVEDEIFEEKIAADVISVANEGRATLIICETIKDAKKILESLREKDHDMIRIFLEEDMVNVTKQRVKPGEVIIATNIAGRGTDLRTSTELEENGGLHVCVAFLPCNKRVEDQAFGRTARQGNKGTAQVVLKQSKVEELGSTSDEFEVLNSFRDLIERNRIVEIRNGKILELNFLDNLFELFSVLYKELRNDFQDQPENEYVLDDLKEFWAFWLEKKNYKVPEIENTSPENEFKLFKSEAEASFRKEIKFNPFYSIKQAEDFILNRKLKEAEAALKHAIRLSQNSEIMHSAYMKLFELEIEKGNVFFDKFQQAVGDLFPIPLPKPEREYKENAKKYLRLAKNAFQKELDYMKDIFEGEDFEIIVNGESELFIKHFCSKLEALELNLLHADSLIQQIDNHEGGILISNRVSDYFKNLKPQNAQETEMKEIVLSPELAELATLGTNTTYALKEVHDVSPEIITGAKVQIGGGIAIIVAGLYFPPAIPITSAIGSTMISEGICDIAIELLIQSSDGKFYKNTYIKGKVISYGMSILTLGISAIMSCEKILTAAQKACRWMAAALRKSPYFLKTCESIATKFDDIANWLDKLQTLAKFNKMSKLQKIEYFETLSKTNNLKKLEHIGKHLDEIKVLQALQKMGKLKELARFEINALALKHLAVSTVKNVTNGVVRLAIMHKVIFPLISSLLVGIKPIIKKQVEESVKEHINREKLKSYSFEEIQEIIRRIKASIDSDTVIIIFKETILGIGKSCSNWKVQLGALILDELISVDEIYTYVKNICKKINERMELKLQNQEQIDEKMVNQLVEELTEHTYAMLVASISRSGIDFYYVGKSAFKNYKKMKMKIDKSIEHHQAFVAGGPATQEHLRASSDVIKRPIYIHEENGNVVIHGEQYQSNAEPVHVSYFSPEKGDPTGHYVPYGKEKEWSLNERSNNCAFDAIGFSLGIDPERLRSDASNQLLSNPRKYIAYYARGTLFKELLLEGGAKYSGDAEKTLDDSHNQDWDGNPTSHGHPRGHTVRMGPAPKDDPAYNASKYSANIKKGVPNKKSAFPSTKDQNEVLDNFLKSPEGISVLNQLNTDPTIEKIAVEIPEDILKVQRPDPTDDTKMISTPAKIYEFQDEKHFNFSKNEDAGGATAVLGHHKGKTTDPDAEVFVLTFFPIKKKITKFKVTPTFQKKKKGKP